MSEKMTVTCVTTGCENEDIPIVVDPWDGSQIVCGPCATLLAPEAEWYVPPPDEELGIDPPAQRAAELIANMSGQERSELAALIAPTPPTLGQEAKP